MNAYTYLIVHLPTGKLDGRWYHHEESNLTWDLSGQMLIRHPALHEPWWYSESGTDGET
jgi:hypothetical protein